MAQKQQVKTNEVVLVGPDGDEVTVTSADDVVKYKFNGYRVKKAGAEAPTVAQVTTTEKKKD